jgi:hypothetical protein
MKIYDIALVLVPGEDNACVPFPHVVVAFREPFFAIHMLPKLVFGVHG